MKQRNPRLGCPRIAQQINPTFGLDLDRDDIRRVLAIHYKPDPGKRGPSWLTTVGHAKDCLWRVDLFLCQSISPAFPLLKSQWAMVVMDQYTRRIIGFGGMLVTGLGLHCVECSLMRLRDKAGRHTSVQITIRCFNTTAGKPTISSLISATTDGRHIVADYLNYRSSPELRIRHGQGEIKLSLEIN